MPRAELTFDKGLVTDVIGVPGALLQLDDGWIDRQGEVRKRGGKTNMSTSQVANFSRAEFVACLPNSYYDGNPRYIMTQTASIAPNYSWAGGSRSGSSITFGTFRPSTTEDVMPNFIRQVAQSEDEIFLAGSTPGAGVKAWSGASKGAYSTGTLSMTSGSTTVTGVGTTWSTNVEKGMYLRVVVAGMANNWFRIASVTNNTTLVLETAPTFSPAVAGASYVISAVAGPLYAQSQLYVLANGGAAFHQGRLFTSATNLNFTSASPISVEHRIRWSALKTDAHPTYTHATGAQYFSDSAFIDIAEGVGGKSTALISYKGMLLIFRESAVFVMRGAVATDGSDYGASVELLIDGVGHSAMSTSPTVTPPVVTSMGVIFADAQGVWVTDGTSVRSLTEGSIGSAWRAIGFSASRDIITTLDLGNRIAFQVYASGGYTGTPTNTFVYDLTRGTWSTQSTAKNYRNVSRENNSAFIGIRYSDGYLDDWSADLTTTNKQDNGGIGPILSITTHPISLCNTSPALGQGRVNNVYVNGYVTDAASDNPDLQVSLLYGRKGFETGATSATVLSSTIDEGTEDVTTRLPVDGAPAKTCVRLKVAQTAVASDARIYGVGVDYTPANVIA